jgi:hypothetical protein
LTFTPGCFCAKAWFAAATASGQLVWASPISQTVMSLA